MQFLETLQKEADPISLHYFYKQTLKTSLKENSTLVSEADLKIEELMREQIQREYPSVEIIGEEYGESTQKSNIKFIIDPIDGTYNFVVFPFTALYYAVESDGVIVAGLVSCPALNSVWKASLNGGAYFSSNNNEWIKCSVSDIDSFDQAHGLHASLYGYEATGLNQDSLLKCLSKTKRQRGFGDIYSHMCVANGSAEFAVDVNLQPWDIAPIKIIVEEAGGKVTDLNGEDSIYTGSLLSSNTLFHEKVLQDYNN